MARVKPPRSAFINFPLGRPCGKPGDAVQQKAIITDVLNLFLELSNPSQIVDLPFEWDQPFDWNDFKKDVQSMLEKEGKEAQKWKL